MSALVLPSRKKRTELFTTLQQTVELFGKLDTAEFVSGALCHAVRKIMDADAVCYIEQRESGWLCSAEDSATSFFKDKLVQECAFIHEAIINKPQWTVIFDLKNDQRVDGSIYADKHIRSLVMVPLTNSNVANVLAIFWQVPIAELDQDVMHAVKLLITSASVRVQELRRWERLSQTAISSEQHTDFLNNQLEAIASVISHDLRAPVRHIDGFLKLLAKKEALGGNHYVSRLMHADHVLHRLIDRLVRLTRFSCQKIVPKSINLSELVIKIMADIQEGSPERALRLEVEPGLLVYADFAMIDFALREMLSNAWKYTERQSLTHIAFSRGGQEKGNAIFHLVDNGVGFCMDYVDKLFKPCQKLHLHTDFPGDGLGLAMVSCIVARHGGRVWGQGFEGEGAKISFTLPASV